MHSYSIFNVKGELSFLVQSNFSVSALIEGLIMARIRCDTRSRE